MQWPVERLQTIHILQDAVSLSDATRNTVKMTPNQDVGYEGHAVPVKCRYKSRMVIGRRFHPVSASSNRSLTHSDLAVTGRKVFTRTYKEVFEFIGLIPCWCNSILSFTERHRLEARCSCCQMEGEAVLFLEDTNFPW